MGRFIATTRQHTNPHSPDSLHHNTDALPLRYFKGCNNTIGLRLLYADIVQPNRHQRVTLHSRLRQNVWQLFRKHHGIKELLY